MSFQTDPDRFEELVLEGIRAIPEEFRRLLENVEVVIQDEPTPAQLRQMEIEPGGTILGLYEGIPRTARGEGYNLVLPDKITIFKHPIEAEAHDEQDLREIVRLTVWHEIAHHFGMDEAQVEAAEDRRRKR